MNAATSGYSNELCHSYDYFVKTYENAFKDFMNMEKNDENSEDIEEDEESEEDIAEILDDEAQGKLCTYSFLLHLLILHFYLLYIIHSRSRECN